MNPDPDRQRLLDAILTDRPGSNGLTLIAARAASAARRARTQRRAIRAGGMLAAGAACLAAVWLLHGQRGEVRRIYDGGQRPPVSGAAAIPAPQTARGGAVRLIRTVPLLAAPAAPGPVIVFVTAAENRPQIPEMPEQRSERENFIRMVTTRKAQIPFLTDAELMAACGKRPAAIIHRPDGTARLYLLE